MVHLATSRFKYMRIKQFDWEKTCEELTIQVNSLAQLVSMQEKGLILMRFHLT